MSAPGTGGDDPAGAGGDAPTTGGERAARSAGGGPPVALGPGDHLLVVDVQHDFLPGGALGVPGGDRILEPVGRVVAATDAAGVGTTFSGDAHPAGHCSFAARGGPWPPHCVVGTPGAELHPDLRLAEHEVVWKGRDLDVDAYSALDGTGLGGRLRAAGVRRVVVCGLATDYCVRATVLDARAAGLEVALVVDAVAAVDVRAGDGDRALAEMRDAGAVLVRAP